jgi:formylmethanofuran dehydrogenase subunit D
MDVFMSPAAQYADYVLPTALPLETQSFNSNRTTLFNIPKLIDPPGEALPEYKITEGIVSYVDSSQVQNVMGMNVGNPAYDVAPMTAEQVQRKAFEDVKKNAGSNSKMATMSFEEYEEKGFVDFATKPLEERINPDFKNFRDYLSDPLTGAPVESTSGKFEVYCQAMIEDYEARRWYNFDNDASRYPVQYTNDLQLVAPAGYTITGIYTKACDFKDGKNDDMPNVSGYDANFFDKMSTDWVANATEKAAKMMSARFVYPIPMYIPLAEGMHGCDNKSDYIYDGMDMRHPDPLGLRGTYPYVMGNHHSIRHAHSCGDNNPLSTEIFKRDGKGGSAFRGMINGADAGAAIVSGKGVSPTDELGVYEPLEISAEDATVLNLKTGDIVLVTSPRGRSLMAAFVTNAIRPGVTNMSEGAWTSFKNCKITYEDGTNETLSVDVAGAANTLSTQRPSRICQGSGYCAYQRIKIQKVTSVEQA